MRIYVLLGPPGAGKGTQAELLEKRIGAKKISSGDIIRREIASQSELGLRVKAVVESGSLVDAPTLFQCVHSTLSGVIAAGGAQDVLLLDGVVRTVEQAERMDGVLAEFGTHLTGVLALEANTEELVQRAARRWMCRSCQAPVALDKPEVAATQGCPSCGVVGQLYRRKDDEPEAVQTRMAVYERDTAPLFAHYGAKDLLLRVNALQSVEKVYSDVTKLIGV